MPHYFIDTNDDDTQVIDEEGQELPDDDSARRLALSSLLDMANATIPDGDQRTVSASVRSERGAVLYQARLSLSGEWLADRSQKQIAPEPGAATAEPSPTE